MQDSVYRELYIMLGWPEPSDEIKTLAVDFDGTLAVTAFPEIIELIDVTIEYCKWHQRNGCKILLHTCREDQPQGNYLTEAVEACRSSGLEFDAVNENPFCEFNFLGPSRKLYADRYLDDKSISFDINKIPRNEALKLASKFMNI